MAPEVIWPVLALLIDQPEATSDYLLHQCHPCPAQVVLVHHLYPHQLLEGELHVFVYLWWRMTCRFNNQVTVSQHRASVWSKFLKNQLTHSWDWNILMTRGSHLGIEIRRQCFSSSETLHKKSFPVRVLMLYACRGASTGTVTANHPTMWGFKLQHCEQVWHSAHFLEVQGVCCLKRTIPPGVFRGCRDYTRSLYCCRCQSLHTAEEPWTLQDIEHSLSWSIEHSSKSTFKARWSLKSITSSSSEEVCSDDEKKKNCSADKDWAMWSKSPEERSGHEVVLSKATNWKRKNNSEGKVKIIRLTQLDQWCHYCVCRPSLSCVINTVKRKHNIWPTSPTLIFRFLFWPNVDNCLCTDFFPTKLKRTKWLKPVYTEGMHRARWLICCSFTCLCTSKNSRSGFVAVSHWAPGTSAFDRNLVWTLNFEMWTLWPVWFFLIWMVEKEKKVLRCIYSAHTIADF